jgi:hypothetical protein
MQNLEVVRGFSGKNTFYEVVDKKTGTKHTIILWVDCDCMHGSNFSGKNKKICSHIAKVFEEILKRGALRW